MLTPLSMSHVPKFQGVVHATGKEGLWPKGELVAVITEGEVGPVGYNDDALIQTIFATMLSRDKFKRKTASLYVHALQVLDCAKYDFIHRLQYGKPAPDVKQNLINQ